MSKRFKYKRNILFDGGVYNLDDASKPVRWKFDKIIEASTSVEVKEVFSQEEFAHVPTGTYYFYINNYELMLDFLMGSIRRLFDLLEKIIKENGRFLLTINYEGPASYVVAIVQDNKVRLIFLDRDDENCRNDTNRFRDPKLEHTIAVCDISLTKYELIRQFRDLFIKIYEENKYYITEEYAEECKKNGASVWQENVLFGMKETIDICDVYLRNEEKIKENKV